MEIIIKIDQKRIKEFDCQRAATSWCEDRQIKILAKWKGPRGHYQEWDCEY